MNGDDGSANFDAMSLHGGNPLSALAGLDDLTLSAPKPVKPPLPELPECLEVADHARLAGPSGRVYAQERAAALAEVQEARTQASVLETMMCSARDGRLAPDWRQRGLTKALADDQAVGVWMKIGAMTGRYWEPQVLAWYAGSGKVGWQNALGAWRVDRERSIWTREMCEPNSASRWAGFDLVHADVDAWEPVLDRQDWWPDKVVNGFHRPWSKGLDAHVLRQQLDRIQLSFDMGMAYGGEPVDWRGEHALRVARWRVLGDRDDEMARLRQMSIEDKRLPTAWLVPGSTLR